MVECNHVNHKFNHLTWCEILSGFAFEKIAQEPFKGNAFHIQISLIEANSLQVIDNGKQSIFINFNILCKHLWVLCFCFLIECVNSIRNRFWEFMRLNLKIVRFTVPSRLLFISDFDKEDFGEFIKRLCRCKFPTLPKRIVAFLKDANEFASFNDRRFWTRDPF